MNHIQSLRIEIDHIDQQLREILARRFALSREIGMLKAGIGIKARDDRRADEIEIQFLTWAKKQGLSRPFVCALWRLVHEESIRQQIIPHDHENISCDKTKDTIRQV